MYTSIVVGTDGSESATKALARARDMAKGTPCKVHVVSAAGKDPTYYGVPDVGADPANWTDEVLQEAGGMLDGVEFTTHSLRGDPATALLDIADRTNADLILVGNRGMARRVFGSVPNTVAHKA